MTSLILVSKYHYSLKRPGLFEEIADCWAGAGKVPDEPKIFCAPES